MSSRKDMDAGAAISRGFPHWTSPWWILILLVLGWGPVYVADWMHRLFPDFRSSAVAFGLGWFLTVNLALTLLATISGLLHLARFLFYRPGDAAKDGIR